MSEIIVTENENKIIISKIKEYINSVKKLVNEQTRLKVEVFIENNFNKFSDCNDTELKILSEKNFGRECSIDEIKILIYIKSLGYITDYFKEDIIEQDNELEEDI